MAGYTARCIWSGALLRVCTTYIRLGCIISAASTCCCSRPPHGSPRPWHEVTSQAAEAQNQNIYMYMRSTARACNMKGWWRVHVGGRKRARMYNGRLAIIK